MTTVRFGVIGCGAIHSTHCRALKAIEHAELAGVFDILPERSTGAAETFSTNAFDSLEALFNGVDAVTICTPSGLHAEIGIRAAQAGRHVLSEKPIDVSPRKAQELIDECRRAGVKLGVISQHRFAPEVRKVKEMVDRGELGRILHCDVYNKWYRTQEYYDSGDWRGTRELDGGCMMNQGIHYIDLAQWIMGGVASVHCFADTLAHEMECEDSSYSVIRYKNGAIGMIQVQTTCYPGFAERVEIHGTIGSAVIEGDRLTFIDIDPEAAKSGLYGKGVVAHPVPPAQPDAAAAVTAAANPIGLWDRLHRDQIADFASAILEDRDPEVRGLDAIQPVREIVACYESSAKDGIKIDVAEVALR